MPDDASRPERRRTRPPRVATVNDRNARHLELVTDNWLPELADLAAAARRAIRPVDGPRVPPTPIDDRVSRLGRAPSDRG